MTGPDETPDAAQAEMTLGDHLDELRKRLFRGVIALVLCTGVAWGFRDQVYAVFMQPFVDSVTMLRADWIEEIEARLVANPELPRTDYFLTADPADDRLLASYEVETRPQVLAWQEGFLIKLKVCLYAGLFVGGPYFLWQLWAFIATGLYRQERRVVLSFFPTSIALFVTGVLFGYLKMVPLGMFFLGAEMRPDQVVNSFRLTDYFSLISGLCLALGVVFQLPLIMIALNRVGLIEAATYAKFRGHFFFAATLIAAILTPPDPITLLMLALPMGALYEIGILCTRFLARKDARGESAVDA